MISGGGSRGQDDRRRIRTVCGGCDGYHRSSQNRKLVQADRDGCRRGGGVYYYDCTDPYTTGRNNKLRVKFLPKEIYHFAPPNLD